MRVEVVTELNAPVHRCFDLARDIDLHVKSMGHTRERAIAGRTSGLIELGEEVTWEARQLCIKQRFTSQITAYSRPLHFQDTMVRGAFTSFVHDHYFDEHSYGTTMRDVVDFRSPCGPLGWIVDRLFMSKHLTRLLNCRATVVKSSAERETIASDHGSAR